MNAVAFDTLKTARALEGKGFSREQSEALAEQLAEGRSIDLSHLATKDELKHEIALLEQRMIIKLGGMLVVITGVLLAAIRYLPAAH